MLIHLSKNIFYLVGGVGNALGNNLSLGALPRDHYSSDPAFGYGQKLGDVLSLVAGGAEFLVGDGMMGTGGVAMAVTAGGAAPVAVPLSASGAAIATHGSVVMGKALLEFSKRKEGQYKGMKQSGRNEKHANLEAKTSAQRNYEQAKEKLAKHRSENRGSPDFKKEETKLKNRLSIGKSRQTLQGRPTVKKGKVEDNKSICTLFLWKHRIYTQ